ncbi:MAG: penicillin-binding transpeptidase domain-containing protein, partial [Alistipes sp.]
ANRKEDYSNFLRKLHLDRTVGLEDFGERKPLFPDNWKKMGGANQAFARLGFGYVIELTPMQMITLYNAVANNGQMVAPLLVREIRRNGELELRVEPKILVD